MSALRLISDTSFSSAAKITVSDCFNSDFDVYKVMMNVGAHYGFLKFLNAQGSVIETGTYDTARENMHFANSFTETKVQNADYGLYGFLETSTKGGSVLWIFRPYDEDTYTFVVGEDFTYDTATAMRISRIMGSLDNAERVTGIQCDTNGGSISGNIRVYGLRTS
tara:strand:- start:387 stop:881 length:495 start_codon:yes stop_codon:yes gene_type:complete